MFKVVVEVGHRSTTRIWTSAAYDTAHAISRCDKSLEFGFMDKGEPTDPCETERRLSQLLECVASVSGGAVPQ